MPRKISVINDIKKRLDPKAIFASENNLHLYDLSHAMAVAAEKYVKLAQSLPP